MSEWIDSREKLPDAPGDYLVYIHGPNDDEIFPLANCCYVTSAYYEIDSALWHVYTDQYYCAYLDHINTNQAFFISHWMPLPDGPYEKGV